MPHDLILLIRAFRILSAPYQVAGIAGIDECVQTNSIWHYYSTSADQRLEKFAEISGGRTYFIDDTKAALDLDQAFQGCLTYQPDITVETEKDIVVRTTD